MPGAGHSCSASFVAVPPFAVGIDVVGRGRLVKLPVVPAQLPIHQHHGRVPAEVQQTIQRVLDVLDIAAAGSQDVVNQRPVLLRPALLNVAHAVHQVEDGLGRVVVRLHARPSGSGRRRAAYGKQILVTVSRELTAGRRQPEPESRA